MRLSYRDGKGYCTFVLEMGISCWRGGALKRGSKVCWRYQQPGHGMECGHLCLFLWPSMVFLRLRANMVAYFDLDPPPFFSPRFFFSCGLVWVGSWDGFGLTVVLREGYLRSSVDCFLCHFGGFVSSLSVSHSF